MFLKFIEQKKIWQMTVDFRPAQFTITVCCFFEIQDLNEKITKFCRSISKFTVH